MATSTQGTVIGLIIQKIEGLALTATEEGSSVTVPVFDGPSGTDEQNNYVVVHGWPGQESAQTAQWVGLGARAMDENYDVCVAIWCWTPGPSFPGAFDTTDAQLTARTNASTIAAAIEQALKDDVTLAIENGGSPPAYPFWTTVAQQPIDQVPPEGLDPLGRFAAIIMRVHVFARIYT